MESLAKVFQAPPKPDGPPYWAGRVSSYNLAFYPREYYVQAAIVGAALVYALVAAVGRWWNRRIVQDMERELTRAIAPQFAHVGANNDAPALLWNGGDQAVLFASGRKGVDTFHATFSLAPRHDPLLYLVSLLVDTFTLPRVPNLKEDLVSFTFKIPAADRKPVGTFAIVAKSALPRVLHNRFDLSFGRLLESSEAGRARSLDERFAIVSEAGNITDRFLGEEGPRGDEQRSKVVFSSLLSGLSGGDFLSLVWTDQPAERPTGGAIPADARVERLELTLRLPRGREASVQAVPLVVAALDIVDALHLTATGRSDLFALRPETVTALKKTRTEVDRVLDKSASKGGAGAADAHVEEQRRAALERFDKLSPAEQAKKKEVEKRRAQRKSQSTVRRR
ncbi:hypothetical protein MSPP1_002192 [Malassezia sp. CBS 17886]|nr:hypothetical protein MSPP1_002192 [Malassezia sp. CBS 17886]